MIIKVCGMRDVHNIREVEALKPDWLGFIFWKRSKRFVSAKPACLPTACKRVGVFVDENADTIRHTAEAYPLDLIQLHGQEPPEVARSLRQWKVIKAFNIASADDLQATAAYEGAADYFLFDTKGKTAGGNGTKFDWDVLSDYSGETPFLLSGGIGPDDAERVRLFHHPKCIGIDLNSRFETEPGHKDINKLKEFIKQIRTYEQDQ